MKMTNKTAKFFNNLLKSTFTTKWNDVLNVRLASATGPVNKKCCLINVKQRKAAMKTVIKQLENSYGVQCLNYASKLVRKNSIVTEGLNSGSVSWAIVREAEARIEYLAELSAEGHKLKPLKSFKEKSVSSPEVVGVDDYKISDLVPEGPEPTVTMNGKDVTDTCLATTV